MSTKHLNNASINAASAEVYHTKERLSERLTCLEGTGTCLCGGGGTKRKAAVRESFSAVKTQALVSLGHSASRKTAALRCLV